MNRSYVIAVVIAIAASGWILSGQFQFDDGTAPAKASDATVEPAPKAEERLERVRVRTIVPETRSREITVNGRTEAVRNVTLRAEVEGRIEQVNVEEGADVKKGDVIARIAVQDRKARLAESKALLRQRRVEHEAATKLAEKGFRSTTKVAEARAYLDAARARVEAMQVEMSNTETKAPFDGMLNERAVELGAFVKIGDSIATLVDLDPMLVVAHVSEREVSGVRVGQAGYAKLMGGDRVEGTIRYVSTVADSTTRTFRVELEVPNGDRSVRDGVTASMHLPIAPIRTHRVSPAVLTLNNAGLVGVKIVDAGDRVRFVPVKILADSGDGVWIAGLDERVRLITVGHEFVVDGQKVMPVVDPGGPSS